MNSSGDDNDASGSQDEPPLASPGNESLEKEETMNTALSHIMEVKNTFHDQEHKFKTYLVLLKDYGAKRIDVPTLIPRVKELFKGYNNLIVGLNCFLQPGCEITLDDAEDDAQELHN
ncbi:Paired amphipathic helix protein Sin3-like 2 [Cardamine amara subsp. amara]|uniref:Paired amphipathic helix protein Sin3-like 2 n=1 Tax=Cardamine amara subsp. amara TaxID=228776 RepID=A0ABD1B1X3_CARAN